jgi:hypothetical protein
MSSKELVDLTLRLHHKTDRAVLVSDDGVEANAKWIPLSQCEVEIRQKGMCVITMPEWLAKDKELI